MASIKRSIWIVLGLYIVLTIAACGSNGTSTGSGPYGVGSSSTGADQTATAGANAGSTSTSSGYGPCGRYCTHGTPTTTTNGSGNTIKTATAMISGKSVTILTNAQGMTLYYRTTDSGSSVCSGGCASAWPPVLVTGSATPSSSTTLPGKLSVSANANGEQVEYNGHPLYTYSGDTAAGQTNGQGTAGIWFVATADLAAGSGTQDTNSGY